MVYDVVIVGSGGAGLSAALSAKEKGATVLVVSEGFPTRSQTCMAQGGINAALANEQEDSVALHIEDTLRSSKGLGSPIMIEKMCEGAIETVEWLNSIGVPFSRTDEGKIAQRRLGGTASSRACYSQDYTGLKILHTLYDNCLKEGITFLNEHLLLSLVDGGATFLDIKTTKPIMIEAKSLIMATGGYSGIYHGFTTNTNQSTGDGIAIAYHAGAEISNMEFVQFHPTGLRKSGVLISESARGAGGHLVNDKGERFVDELGARDVVSRAIWAEIEKGNEVFLDIRHLGEEFIDENIPQERKLSIMYEGVDPVSEMMPIAPVAHYSMGGIAVDDDLMSTVSGFFAVGECSNARVHGANRLGGNSLLEIVAFGRLAGENAAKFSGKLALKEKDDSQAFIEGIYDSKNEVDFYEKRELLGELFYKNAGIVRNETALKSLLVTLEEMKKVLPLMGIVDSSRCYNTNLTEFIKFQNTLEVGIMIAQGALNREESRGAHYREDFPDMNVDFEKDTLS
ncbi:MAG TPA: FAD-dependent oxidoreductase [Campylobacterales bacterium]|nr:FAD-dependent oxidoreductase [Campylobacterales bacterium]